MNTAPELIVDSDHAPGAQRASGWPSAGPRRQPRRASVMRTPSPLSGYPGLVLVDATWGTVQPMSLHPEVTTIGELELIAHMRAGGALVDCRLAGSADGGTIPGAVAIPHTCLERRLAELDPERPTALFCNGPQCPATADAVGKLLAAGWSPAVLRYYRGGIHDWVTLGYPLHGPTG